MCIFSTESVGMWSNAGSGLVGLQMTFQITGSVYYMTQKLISHFLFFPVIILAYDRDFFGGVVDGSKKWFFWFVDKSAGSADNNEKMLGKVLYNLFEPESII